MRFPMRVALFLVWSVVAGAGVARAQGASSAGAPQEGTHARPMRHPTHHERTPVVAAHGAVHPQRPAAAQGKAPAAQPVPAVAAAPPADAKAGAAAQLPDPEKPDGAVAKVPRFVSLRSDDVNMRAGPGTRYRIDWVYKRRDLPVEIEREFDVWRWVRDPDGVQGWVHQATLMGRRDFVVQNADATLRAEASDTASPVAILKPGVIGRIRSCEAGSAWCQVQTGSYRGFLRRTQFWGVFPDEAINP